MSLDQKTIISAVNEAKGRSKRRNFTQSVELILTLQDVDVKSPEGRIQENVELPFPPSKKANKVCVIASGELALQAKKANADLVIERDGLEKLAGKRKELRKIANAYDSFIVEAPLMPLVGKIFGAFLGPRGKMPTPVPPTANVAALMEKHRRTITVRVRNQPIVQCRVGTEDMNDEEIAENIQAVLRSVERKLKRGIKSIKSAYVKTSMGEVVKIKL